MEPKRHLAAATAVAGLMALLFLAVGLPFYRGADLPALKDPSDIVPLKAPKRSFYHAASGERRPFSEPFCSTCHQVPPHKRSPRFRSILNFHGEKLHCLVCHGLDFIKPAGELALQGGRIQPLVNGESVSADTAKNWRERAAAGAKCFSSGPRCLECHQAAGLVDFAKLGYDANRVSRLRKLQDYQTGAMEKWFFPAFH